jgi:hypothetical protein
VSRLDYLRVGRTTVWRGAPVRAAVAIELLGVPGDERARVQLIVRPQEGDEFRAGAVEVDSGRHIFELSSEGLPAGSAELAVLISPQDGEASGESGEPDGEEITVPEQLWILEREQYRELLQEEAEEEFGDSPALGGSEIRRLFLMLVGERLSPLALARDLPATRSLIRERWAYAQQLGWEEPGGEELLLPGHFPAPLAGFEPYGAWPWAPEPFALLLSWPDAGVSWPAAPVRWAMEKLLSMLHELCVPGISHLMFEVVGREEGLELGVVGRALTPPSRALVEAFSDEELGDVATVGWIAPGVTAGYRLEPGDPSFAIRLGLDRDMFAR